MIIKKLRKKNIMIVGATLLIMFVMSTMTVSADLIRENDEPVTTDDSDNGATGLTDEEPLVIAPNPGEEPLVISSGSEDQSENILADDKNSVVTADMAVFGGILSLVGFIGLIAIVKRRK